MFHALSEEFKPYPLPGQDRKGRSLRGVGLSDESDGRHVKSRPVQVLQAAVKRVCEAKFVVDKAAAKPKVLGGKQRERAALTEADLKRLLQRKICSIEMAGFVEGKPLLQTLDLSCLRIRGSISELVDAILKSPSNKLLYKLILASNGLSDANCSHVQRLLECNSSVGILNLDDNPFGEAGVQHLCEGLTVGGNTTLRNLQLNTNSFGDAGACALFASLGVNTTLHALSLAECSLTSQSVQGLKSALGFNRIHLKSLTLSEPNALFPRAGDQLAALMGASLRRNHMLTSLSLPSNRISDEGCGDLALALMQNDTLGHLNLRANCIGSWGAAKLGELLHVNTTLHTLDLSSNDIGAGADAMKLYWGMEANTTLTCLEVHNNTQLKGFMEMANEFLQRNAGLLADRQARTAAHLQEVHEKIVESDQLVQGIVAKATQTIHKERRQAARFKQEQNPTRITPGSIPEIGELGMRVEEVHFAPVIGQEHHDLKLASAAHAEPGLPVDTSIESTHSQMLRELHAGLAMANQAKREQNLIERLFPHKRVRLYLHTNNPRRRGRGMQVVLPNHIKGIAVWDWLLSEANRKLEFNGWPGRRVYLDSALTIKISDGTEEIFTPGTELESDDLDVLQDGVELVISDGRGDGQSLHRRYIPRGGATKLEKIKIRSCHEGQHWSVVYWAIFSRFYRARKALLEWDAEKSTKSSMSSGSLSAASLLDYQFATPSKPRYAWAQG